ncbi:hypothetical protein BDU57DRAFT_512537 [Ampelomyces quisqualis]|uniref:Uncharacterized protein n=1 Tax=Ampelomyces quisqualis TaxID=50730 RepID=A0A6A5QVQ2_AMPQU|nr:hypothetical protein BDU57DRAFT_512537 [Ampelomyces quisqualis]
MNECLHAKSTMFLSLLVTTNRFFMLYPALPAPCVAKVVAVLFLPQVPNPLP